MMNRMMQLVGYRRNRFRRAATFREAFAQLPYRMKDIIEWWDELAVLEIKAQRRALESAVPEEQAKAQEARAFYDGQRRVLEWLISGAVIANAPRGPDA